MAANERERVHVTSRAELRSWLEAHADTSPSIWLVTHRSSTGLPAPSYDDIVEEALCFGWIDSTLRRLDDRTTMLLLSPRKPRSTWAATNKERVERLIASGRMTARGLEAIAAAKANGSWSQLDAVDRLEEPADLAAALDANGPARAFFDAMPPGARRQNLWYVISAKRAATRAERIERIVSAAAMGRRVVG